MDFLAGQQVLLAGDHADATPADNATATATATPATGSDGARGRLILLGVSANYTAAVAAFKTITVTYTRPGAGTTNTITIPYDFSQGPYNAAFPAPLTTERGTVATATLGASGAGGISGNVTLWFFQT